jgi:hypothetical protein
MSQLQFKGQATVPIFPSVPVWRPGEPVTELARMPLAGEPHIHHRAYLRPPSRDHRLHKVEVADYIAQNRDELARLGFRAEDGAPVIVDRPDLIVAHDTGEVDAFDPYGLTKR